MPHCPSAGLIEATIGPPVLMLTAFEQSTGTDPGALLSVKTREGSVVMREPQSYRPEEGYSICR